MDGEIDPEELSALLDERGDSSPDESLRIVDIRDRRAFDRGHLPDSECIPFPELTNRIAELEGSDRIVTVCPHGVASQQAAQLIGSYEGTQDARVDSLRGGIEAWEREIGDLPASDEPAASDPDEGPESPF
ncbi:rhodanese-like domain-containing protein [Halorubrum ezzemoulense]|jgi:rhodanese-related sulfurtransferase|uniref:Rhodanese n=2 Tax=Halorubrum ezzemoulense TaxID=337243 RepID=A0A256JBN3_HALEZ|nr:MULTISPECIES: rhodanese-like domain-containing protein [Halorubrum]MDB2223291.1 rhodanese-like domain-containing protein [Halorubrum ezzemoulense]MDB2237743.1 rhodanese-like domain-containing protein [Halorubrum ezzemoulense]MDB2240659.1 rhodanese-like domain-containing protein [Halorubrum ezzemoulense]MDB2248763.1 rhodanese-like domain-containing protein [Halorubrum ezzemoulense]MDB2264266.1 rhodanese-like domain-containing protein [Halorubrum ezzemoulense]